MSALVRNASMPIATVLGVTLCAPWAVSVFAAPAQLNDATQSQVAPVLHSGDLVRLRSGGPLMTVITVRNDQVICSWSGEDGEPRSGSFQIGLVTAPVTIPPDDPTLQKDERTADQYYRKHCPSGIIASGKFECAY